MKACSRSNHRSRGVGVGVGVGLGAIATLTKVAKVGSVLVANTKTGGTPIALVDHHFHLGARNLPAPFDARCSSACSVSMNMSKPPGFCVTCIVCGCVGRLRRGWVDALVCHAEAISTIL
jgi:hypothetical protein